jgi:hypothetical protein
MNIGMMWFDNDPKTDLTEKISRAAEYYRSKYGRNPDVCLVNPAVYDKSKMQTGKILVRPLRTVLPGHLWIGVDEKAPIGAD